MTPNDSRPNSKRPSNYATSRFVDQNQSEFENDLDDQSSYTTLMTEIYTSGDDEEETDNLYGYLPTLKKDVTAMGIHNGKTLRSARSEDNNGNKKASEEKNNTTIKDKTLVNQT